ncbi:DeoR family transcriptional regulator [Chromobacterium alkanivorans]|uniref:DeoR/GlpR family DNA-binding transcription regulator n=1 Tax=Chromobacterium TaxID=535 RepID=UPI00065455DA|nr:MULTISPECIES: DeoR family transcriptional regulator [Chromobacterium]KMN83355.1 DeoR faimly transcriptional regulator [Chromobacterium sp. LK11]MBN3004925.1 DeoR family transcriptional regulator [Chromobacterium alkanivorans]
MLILNQRQQELLAMVKRDSYVSVEKLAEHFSVTRQTIRRDIALLAEHQLLQRYHGGASVLSSVENVAYQARQVLCIDEKRRIAECLARQIPDNASLFINLGTTTEEVAKALHQHRGLRVITNNLHVADTMCDYPDCEVIVLGGMLRKRDRGITGEATVQLIRQFRVDYGIIGISSIELDGTLRDYDYREVRSAEAIIQQSRHVFLAADHSKFDRPALVELGHLSQIDALFTDQPPPPAVVELMREAETQLYVAD